jgi:hypothetical protein
MASTVQTFFLAIDGALEKAVEIAANGIQGFLL